MVYGLIVITQKKITKNLIEQYHNLQAQCNLTYVICTEENRKIFENKFDCIVVHNDVSTVHEIYNALICLDYIDKTDKAIIVFDTAKIVTDYGRYFHFSSDVIVPTNYDNIFIVNSLSNLFRNLNLYASTDLRKTLQESLLTILEIPIN